MRPSLAQRRGEQPEAVRFHAHCEGGEGGGGGGGGEGAADQGDREAHRSLLRHPVVTMDPPI